MRDAPKRKRMVLSTPKSNAEKFDDRIAKLQRSGKMPTFHQFLGALGKDKITPPEGAADEAR